MNRLYYDLCVKTSERKVLENAASLGWNGICSAVPLDEIGKISNTPKNIGSMEVYTGIIVGKDVEKNARRALDIADLVLVSGGDDEVNRQAAECWDVDILMHPELNREKDFMDYKNAGLDGVMASCMAERGIALGIDFSKLLECYGRNRTQVLGRIQQNIKVALKHKVLIVLASSAKDTLGQRSPQDLSAIAPLLGVPEHIAIKIVSEYPGKVVEKMKARNNPNILLKGLEVLDWGMEKPKQKKKYGWY